MSDERNDREEWDRSQWAEEGKAPDAPGAATWDREPDRGSYQVHVYK